MAAKFDLMKTLSNQNKENVVNGMLFEGDKLARIPYNQIQIGRYKKYEIDPKEVEELAVSISTIGLEQNLVVKETEDPSVYVIVTGHKRLSAINYIFNNSIEISEKLKKELEMPNCVVVSKDESELITRFRMHETNVHQRSGFNIAEIEDYLEIVEEAKKNKTEVNGKRIVGTTRALLHTRFGMSEAMAKKYIKVIKEGNQELKDKLDNGDISVNNAYEFLQGKNKLETKRKKTETNIDYEINDFIKDIYKPYKSMQKAIEKVNENYEILQIEDTEGEVIDKKVFDLLEDCKTKMKEIMDILNTAVLENGKK